jgi:hypothetical protein
MKKIKKYERDFDVYERDFQVSFHDKKLRTGCQFLLTK